eukprot:1161198-Pelagomonas_calceolata.AAC.6
MVLVLTTNWLAIQCSNPIAAKAEMGSQMPTNLPVMSCAHMHICRDIAQEVSALPGKHVMNPRAHGGTKRAVHVHQAITQLLNF